MSSTREANNVVAMRLAEAIISRGGKAALDQLIADGYVNHNIPVSGTEAGFQHLVAAPRQALPDVTFHLEGVVAEGDMVAFHDHVTATSQGEFFGDLPTANPLAGPRCTS